MVPCRFGGTQPEQNPQGCAAVAAAAAANTGVPHPARGGPGHARPKKRAGLVAWRSATALSLAELGRHGEARALAADEVRRAQSFGAARALGIALRAQALVGPQAERLAGLQAALSVLADSPAALEHARVLVDLGATLRSAGQRTAAREPRAGRQARHQSGDRADVVRDREDDRDSSRSGAFRKLDITTRRRQLPDVLAGALA